MATLEQRLAAYISSLRYRAEGLRATGEGDGAELDIFAAELSSILLNTRTLRKGPVSFIERTTLLCLVNEKMSIEDAIK